MRKIVLTCFLFAMGTFAAFAEQVTPSEAKQKAAEFLNSTASANAPRRAKAAKATLLQVWPAATNTASKVKLKAPATNTGADYYIFNTADSTAFVVVSGESTTRSILAYSTEGFFNMDDIAPGAQYLLDGYAEQIEMVKNGEAVAKTDEPILYADGGKLLETANFNQHEPYYNLCPSVGSDKCVTGCVATAMAIVMKYHNWPTTGVGNNSYETETHKFSLSADFNTTYDWNNILTAYGSYYDETQGTWLTKDHNSTQDAAVAKLVYHCGVAVNMNYTPYGSNASSSDAPKALRKNFKYDIYTREYQRMDYTDAIWKQMLMAEIDANRPMIYSGQSSTYGGHSFVCDGYSADGTFHFNMGWGNSENGYYSIDGIVDDYNLKHLAIMGITPDQNFDANYTAQLEMATYKYNTVTSEDNRGLKMETPANIIKGHFFGITAYRLKNVLSSTFNGYVAAALFDATGTTRKSFISSNSTISDLESDLAYPIRKFTCKVPTDIDMQPTDRIWIMSSTDGKTWYKVYCCSDETSSLPVSGYPGVFFCQGHNGQDAYVYGNVTDDVKSQLAAQTDVTRIDLTNATQSNTFDFTGVNPNAYVEGTTASITGALTKSLTALQLTDNKPYYADGTQSVNKVTFTRAFNAGGASSTSSAPLWQTICLPFNVTSVTYNSKTLDVSNYWLYKIGANGYERVRTGNIEANTPYLIAFACGTQYGDESVSGDVTFAGAGTLQTTDVTSELYATNNYKMVGYYGPNITDSTRYALNTTGTCFVSGDAINPFHPYAIVPDEANPAKGHVLSIFGGDVTAIEAVGADKADGGVKIVPAKGGVNVTATKAGTVNVYSTSGALLGVFGTSEGTTFIRLPQGIFVVNGVKVMVSE